MVSDWRPCADRATLVARAALYQEVRRFFAERGVLEVNTPCLSPHGVTDVQIENLWLWYRGERMYLQTSPEYFMKRLVAAGSGDIYQIGPGYRGGEQGRLHCLEFILLEWYRLEFDHFRLMDEVRELVDRCLGTAPVRSYGYRELLHGCYDVDLLDLDIEELRSIAGRILGICPVAWQRDDLLDAFYAEALEQHGQGRIFVYDFPASQAALARLKQDEAGRWVAARFEMAIEGVEIANGYFELADPGEQSERFQNDRNERRRRGLPVPDMDPNLLAALRAGLPDCSGVALGLDRLLMIQLGAGDLQDVLTFSNGKAWQSGAHRQPFATRKRRE